ncbi:helix-turn-helix domain-containing protein [Haemophilus influenzae]|uniref:helix-turn-helix domain-containing protein n=1 Tax=Haemophilus influenzae TaxID=727 RepID=UPI000D01EE0B|nr:helix-turn-helix domain-containing protein [Haemophilus influenzae]PRJ90593.1 transcriptional repressor DicA [Haemophilus influenzae]PRK61325.1 transcriptional repressor DicA [Haemophilus influenzae]
MNNVQYIKNPQGKAEFVVLPIAYYEELLIRAIPYDDEDETEWEAIPVDGEDDGATIPHEVVGVMLENDVSLLAAWRIYRRLSQQEVAERAGITQSALSQAERKDSKPQKKTRKKLAKIYQCKPEQLLLD